MAATEAPYKLKIRLPNSAEFEGEGPLEIVRTDYERFLEAAGKVPATNGGSQDGPPSSPGSEAEGPNGPEPAQWDRAFMRKGDYISLHVLPKGKTVTPDALMLLLYGYHMLLKQDSVRSSALMEGAKQSGLRIDRIDRNLPTSHTQFIIKGGSGRGSRYSLNNRGLKRAQEMLEGLFE